MKGMRATDPDATAVQLRERIREDGYLFLPGLVGSSDAYDCAQTIIEILREDAWLRPETGDKDDVCAAPTRGQEPPEYWRTFNRILGLESLNQLCWDPKIDQVITNLVGEGRFCFPQKIPRIGFPLSSGWKATPPHRDNRGGTWIRDMFTVWLALDAVPVERGGLAVLRGSHTYRYTLPPEAGTESVGGGLSERAPGNDHYDWLTTDYRAGDAVIFHAYTIHKTLPNLTGSVRLSIDSRWQDAGDPGHLQALMPHHYFDRFPAIGSWADLTATWRDARWCSFPKDMEIITSKHPAGYPSGVPASKFFDLVDGAADQWREDTFDIDRFTRIPAQLPPTL